MGRRHVGAPEHHRQRVLSVDGAEGLQADAFVMRPHQTGGEGSLMEEAEEEQQQQVEEQPDAPEQPRVEQ